MAKTYFKELDVLKGIGICLVVFGHLSLPKDILKFIHHFTIPLFFFISGFVFKPKNNFEFIRDKFQRILLPFYIFSTITFLVHYLTNFPSAAIASKDFLIGTLFGIASHQYLSWNVALWFLPALFFTNVLFNVLDGYSKRNRDLIGFVLCLMSLLILKERNWTFLPFHVGAALLMVPFFIIGSWLRKHYLKILEVLYSNNRVVFVTSILVILVGISISNFNSGYADVRLHMIGDVFFFYPGAFVTIMGLLLFARFIKFQLLIWLGLNSLLIMCVHMPLMEFAFKIIKFIPFDDHAYGVLSTTIIILFCVPFVFLINRFFPVAAGIK